MATSERRERERERLRTLILDSARTLFASEGYEAVSMRKIAARIDYSATAIYAHFPDKETLLRELCSADFLALAVEFRRIARVKDPVARLRKIAEAYFRFGLAHPNHYRFMFMTPLPDVVPEAKAIEKGNPEEDAYAFLRATIAECVARGRFRPSLRDVEMLTQMAWAGIHGIVSLHIAKGNSSWVAWRAPAKTAKQMIDVMIFGLTGKKA